MSTNFFFHKTKFWMGCLSDQAAHFLVSAAILKQDFAGK